MDNEIMDFSAIFVFTKDRPVTLKQTLNSLNRENIEIYVIDDSYYEKNQSENYTITKQLNNVIYCGRKEFNNYLASNDSFLSESGYLIDKLGNKNWNLGNARNFALLLAKSYGFENVLFMDDDIIVTNSNLISDSFKLLEHYLFVGAKIIGMQDHSIIGHIAKKLDLYNESERMLSGGFLAFNPQIINMHFTNIYNEDWIWMLMQLNNKIFLEYGEVEQIKFDPFFNYKNKIVFQEFGEIVIEGLFKSHNIGDLNMLTDSKFWKDIINKRKKYLNKILENTKIKKEKSFTIIVSWLKTNHINYTSALFKDYFEIYFEQNQRFGCLLDKMSTALNSNYQQLHISY